MKNFTTKTELSRIVRSAGLQLAMTTGSRISGWGNIGEGVYFSTVYAFKNRYQRDGRYHFWYSTEESHDIRLSWTSGTRKVSFKDAETEGTKLEQVLKESEIEHKIVNNRGQKEFVFQVKNPYFDCEVKCSCGKTH